MASEHDIDRAVTYDERMAKKPVGKNHIADTVYIEYEKDIERIQQQQMDTLSVLTYYRKTKLIPTNRRLIPTDKDLQFLIEILGLEDIE